MKRSLQVSSVIMLGVVAKDEKATSGSLHGIAHSMPDQLLKEYVTDQSF